MSEQTDSETAEASATTDGTARTTATESTPDGRGTFRRRVLRGAVGAGILSAIAGCSGSGDGGGSDGEDGGSNDGGTPTGTATDPATSTATTSNSSNRLTSEVSELTIVSAEQDVSEETDPLPSGIWMVHLEVRNTGDQETDVFEYDYEGTVYDADGNEIGRIGGKGSGRDSVAAPGETGTVRVSSRDVDPDNVGRFEVTISCSSISEGVYCDNP